MLPRVNLRHHLTAEVTRSLSVTVLTLGLVFSEMPVLTTYASREVPKPFGAQRDPTGKPIGGGEDYGDWVTQYTIRVSTKEKLIQVLTDAQAGEVIYVDDDAEIDLSGVWDLPLKAGVTLASGRGRNGSLGALLFTKTNEKRGLFQVLGENVRITGLRIQGPDPNIKPEDCGGHDAKAINIETSPENGPVHMPEEIDNNELWAWPGSAISIHFIGGVHVHHNYIHHNRRALYDLFGCRNYGLGYGVIVGGGGALIEGNLFANNRHDIASNGQQETFYEARYNLVLNGAVSHSFDVHGFECRSLCCGRRRAGNIILIHHNTFVQSGEKAVMIRGVPFTGAYVYDNTFAHSELYAAVDQCDTKSPDFDHMWVYDNQTGKRPGPAWFVSWNADSYWQFRRFDALSLKSVGFGDFDGDGRTDILRTTGENWEMSRGGKDDWVVWKSSAFQLSDLGFGDFDGDRKTDVLRTNGRSWYVALADRGPWHLWKTSAYRLSDLGFGDFNGDEKTDVIRTTGQEWVVALSGSGPWQHWKTSSYELRDLAFADFNGDGRTDVLRTTNDTWYVAYGGNGPWEVLNTSHTDLEHLAFGDFNGDGRTDVFMTVLGHWYIAWSGRSPWSKVNSSDYSLDDLAFGDFNGDGNTDVLVLDRPW